MPGCCPHTEPWALFSRALSSANAPSRVSCFVHVDEFSVLFHVDEFCSDPHPPSRSPLCRHDLCHGRHATACVVLRCESERGVESCGERCVQTPAHCVPLPVRQLEPCAAFNSGYWGASSTPPYIVWISDLPSSHCVAVGAIQLACGVGPFPYSCGALTHSMVMSDQ